MLKVGLLLALVAAVGGCLYGGVYREPNWRNIESGIMEQAMAVPEPVFEYWVSPATPYEELRDQMDAMIAQGWEVDEVTPAGKELPTLYLVTYRR